MRVSTFWLSASRPLFCVGLLWAAGITTAIAQAPARQWDRTLGGDDSDLLSSAQRTADGGYLLGGSSQSGASGDKTQAGRGATDYWVTKLDAAGAKQWDKTFGGTADDVLTSLQQTADGGYLLGGYSHSATSADKSQPGQGGRDFWVLKLDAAGLKQWDRTFGGAAADVLISLQQTQDGGYILGGTSASGAGGDKTQPLQGSSDYWLVKLDAAGTKQWDKTFGGTGTEDLAQVRQTPDGGYVLAGTSDSGASGDKTQAGRGSDDFWVVKLDASGSKQWDMTYGGDLRDMCRSILPTLDGGYLLLGTSSSNAGADKSQAGRGGFDYWAVKISATGQKQWDQTLGGSGWDEAQTALQTPDGGYVLGGSTQSSASGDRTQVSYNVGLPFNDFWLVRLSPNGTRQWNAGFGGTSNDNLAMLAQTPDGGYVLAGSSNSRVSGDKSQAPLGPTRTINLNDGVLRQEHYEDFWVVKLGATTTAAQAAARVGRLETYPNPTRANVSVVLPEAPRQSGTWQLSLLDATGRVVYRQPLALTAAQRGSVALPTSLARGLYQLRVQSSTGYSAAQRLVLE